MRDYTIKTVNMLERPPTGQELANYSDHLMVDGWPVLGQLQEFAKAIKKVRPNIRFGSFSLWNSHERWELEAYIEGEPYTIGSIAIERGERRYVIESRLIENKQFADWRSQHHRRMSSNKTTAVRIAKNSLVPVQPIEIIKQTFGDFCDEHNKGFRVVGRDLYEAASKCKELFSRDSAIDHSLWKNMLMTGTLEDTALETIKSYVDLKDAASEMRSEKVSCSFVTVREHENMSIYTVQPIDKEFSVGDHSRRLSSHALPPLQTYFDDELPEHVMQKMVVLNMLADEGYVAGVGQKVNRNVYYIYDYVEAQDDGDQ